jgi:hypothetical protein
MTVTESPQAGEPAVASAWHPAVPGNAGHSLDKAPLPYWLDRPCPPWCLMTIPHEDGEMPSDRQHMSVFYEVDLTQEPPLAVSEALEDEEDESATLSAGLWQHHTARDPHLTLIINHGTDVEFTLAEAGELAAALSAPGDEYTMITLTLEDSDRHPPRGPRRAGQEPKPVYRPRMFGVRLEPAGEAADLSATERRVVAVYRDTYLTLTLSEAAELASGISDLLGEAAAGPHEPALTA